MENIEANIRVLKRSLVGQMHYLISLSLISSSFKFPQEHTRTIWGEKILLIEPADKYLLHKLWKDLAPVQTPGGHLANLKKMCKVQKWFDSTKKKVK